MAWSKATICSKEIDLNSFPPCSEQKAVDRIVVPWILVTFPGQEWLCCAQLSSRSVPVALPNGEFVSALVGLLRLITEGAHCCSLSCYRTVSLMPTGMSIGYGFGRLSYPYCSALLSLVREDSYALDLNPYSPTDFSHSFLISNHLG